MNMDELELLVTKWIYAQKDEEEAIKETIYNIIYGNRMAILSPPSDSETKYTEKQKRMYRNPSDRFSWYNLSYQEEFNSKNDVFIPL